jgi:hypothetical protein
MAAGDDVRWTDISTIQAATTGKPIGRIVASGVTVLADNTQVAIPFSGTDDIDTHGYHDPAVNNTRVTPSLAGYYRFAATGFFEAQTTPVVSDVNLRKNGTSNLAPAWRNVGQIQAFSGEVTALVSMNGTSDYIELVMRQDSAGADNTNQSSQFSSVLEWEYVRPL